MLLITKNNLKAGFLGEQNEASVKVSLHVHGMGFFAFYKSCEGGTMKIGKRTERRQYKF